MTFYLIIKVVCLVSVVDKIDRYKMDKNIFIRKTKKKTQE
jgi:hypothetical protein